MTNRTEVYSLLPLDNSENIVDYNLCEKKITVIASCREVLFLINDVLNRFHAKEMYFLHL